MRLKLFQNVLVPIFTFIAVQSNSEVLKSSEFEDKDIPYLLNWDGDAERNTMDENGEWSSEVHSRSGDQSTFNEKVKDTETRASEKRRGFSDAQRLIQSREAEDSGPFKQGQPFKYQGIPANMSQVAEYIPERNIVQQPKQFQSPQSPLTIGEDDDFRNVDDRNCGTPVKRPNEEPSMMNRDDQFDKNRDQSRQPTAIPLNNFMNSKGVTISIMVPFMDPPQSCKSPAGSQQSQQQQQQCRQPMIGPRLDSGGRNKWKFKDKKGRHYSKCAKKAVERNKIVSSGNNLDNEGSIQVNHFTEPPRLNYIPSEENSVWLEEFKKNRRQSALSPLDKYNQPKLSEKTYGGDQWKVLDKILELDLRKRDALDSLSRDGSADYFDDHLVRNKRLLFFHRKSKIPPSTFGSSNDESPCQHIPAGMAPIPPPVAPTQKNGKKKKKSLTTPSSISLNKNGKRMKHMRLWKDKATTTSSSNQFSTVSPLIAIDAANKDQQQLNTRVLSDGQYSGLKGIQTSQKLLNAG